MIKVNLFCDIIKAYKKGKAILLTGKNWLYYDLDKKTTFIR